MSDLSGNACLLLLTEGVCMVNLEKWVRLGLTVANSSPTKEAKRQEGGEQ